MAPLVNMHQEGQTRHPCWEKVIAATGIQSGGPQIRPSENILQTTWLEFH